MKTDNEIQLAKAVPMVAILHSFGFEPIRTHGNEFVFYSPFREERTPSFSVDTKQNLWSDLGQAEKYKKGDSSVGFIMLYQQLTFPAAVEWLLTFKGEVNVNHYLKAPEKQKQLELLSVKSITDLQLVHYAESRGITMHVLHQYCHEIIYRHIKSDMIYKAIGFQNDSQGYELRYRGKEDSNGFKGCLGKKDITFFNHGKTDILVFEGFFNFLSFVELNIKAFEANFLILNSLSLLNRFDFSPYKTIYSYLDNDKPGYDAFFHLQKKYPAKNLLNCSTWCYPNQKDLNEYLQWQNAKRLTERN